jgi:hypothetical protein
MGYLEIREQERKEILMNDLQGIAKIIEPLTEEYFGEEFIREYLKEYDIKKRPRIAELLNYPGENKFTINLALNCTKHFNENKISGYGISSLVHELAHIYQHHLFKNLNKLDYYLKEAHADISMYEILRTSNKPKLKEGIKEAIIWNNYNLNHENKSYKLAYRLFNNQKDMEKRKILLGQTELFERYVSLVA